MSSVKTPIITADNSLDEEKIILCSTSKIIMKCVFGIFFTIWLIMSGNGVLFIYKHFEMLQAIIPGIFCLIGVGGIITSFFIPERIEVAINNINKTLKLQKICNRCCKKSPRIINLNQINKINIMSSSVNNDGNVRTTTNFIIVYENGTTENISNYFSGYSEHALADLQNLLRKYLVVENTMPQMIGLQQVIPSNNIYNQNIPIQQNYIPVINDVSNPNYSKNCEAPSLPD